MDIVLFHICLVFIPSSSSSGGSSSKDVDPTGALYPGVVKEVEAGDELMSKDMKGRLGVDERGGWKGAVGRRRWGAVALGLPPDGKITGGTVNSFLFDMVMKSKSDRKCFRCGNSNHLIIDCPKPPRNKDQKAFVRGCWSDNENEAKDKTNDETCLMAQSSNKVCLRTYLEPEEWISDSGCSKQITGNKSLLSNYKAYNGALDEGFSSKNYVRKFLRAIHPKWREKVTAIKESKGFPSLALDELIDNLKVHEVVMEKDSNFYKGKKKMVKSIALKANKESNDDETSTSKSNDEEYAMVVRNFKKFF
uniref:UBN2 domain-containing protein n=1 Tax=Tanacetum cinerariifolium TaxID=118510 RepID=A0A6L2LBR7_TANCI|nr:UBN2 domain-containing protein [Tanacetum cinerariifolium]